MTSENINPLEKLNTEENFKQKANLELVNKETVESVEIRKKQEKAKIEDIREKLGIIENKENKTEKESNLIENVRLFEKFPSGSIELSKENNQLISEVEEKGKESLSKNYEPNFGISPSSDSNDNFYDQIWSRDGAHAVGNYYARANPKAVCDSLETTFRHQRDDGQLPLRVERVYAPLRLIPGVGVWLSKKLFDLFEEKKNGRKENAVYKGEDMSGGEDTVPATIIAIGELFIASKDGKDFVEKHYDQIKKSIEHFRTKIDKEDGLADLDKSPDWAETIQREGKLGTINVWWARALRLMEFMSKQLGHKEDSVKFKEEFNEVKKNILEKIYNKKDAYFRTEVGKDQVDTVASVFGSLFLLNPAEAARVQETLTNRTKHSSGLVNFDPPYPKEKISGFVRMVGNAHYHNENVWPWVTCENIQVKIKIALQHPDQVTREKYKKEAIEDLVSVSKLFRDADGAYEVMKPDTPEKATGQVKLLGLIPVKTYSPAKNFMGNLAAYQGAYEQLKKLKWI